MSLFLTPKGDSKMNINEDLSLLALRFKNLIKRAFRKRNKELLQKDIVILFNEIFFRQSKNKGKMSNGKSSKRNSAGESGHSSSEKEESGFFDKIKEKIEDALD